MYSCQQQGCSGWRRYHSYRNWKERTHGTKKLIIGTFKPGQVIDLLEDVVTTGGSLLKAAQTLRDAGARVDRAVCVVDREEGALEMLRENGIDLLSLVKVSEIL